MTDAAVLLGPEANYGTAATLTRAYEAKADGWKRNPEFMESVGMRAGMHTARSDRRRVINMGAAGELEVDVLDRGMGVLLDGILGTTTGPTTGLTTFTSDKNGTAKSWTAQVLRPTVLDTVQAFTYVGAVPTGWTLSQEVGKYLNLKVNFDAQDEKTDVAAGTPQYPANGELYDWTQCVVTIGGSPVDVDKFSVQAELGMKVDRRHLRGSALKKQPKRAALPTYTGDAEAEFENLTIYQDFIAGTIVPIVATWQFDATRKVVVTLAACQFNGDSPQAATDALTKQPCPFRVLHNGTDPAVKIEVYSPDTAL